MQIKPCIYIYIYISCTAPHLIMLPEVVSAAIHRKETRTQSRGRGGGRESHGEGRREGGGPLSCLGCGKGGGAWICVCGERIVERQLLHRGCSVALKFPFSPLALFTTCLVFSASTRPFLPKSGFLSHPGLSWIQCSVQPHILKVTPRFFFFLRYVRGSWCVSVGITG